MFLSTNRAHVDALKSDFTLESRDWNLNQYLAISGPQDKVLPRFFIGTVAPTKSDSDVILCLQSLSKTLTCTLHLS